MTRTIPALCAALVLSACAGPASPPGAVIGIEGAWTLEVRDPGGSLVERREFHNAYVDDFNLLPMVLGGERTPGIWRVSLWGANPAADNNICQNESAQWVFCDLTEGNTSNPDEFPLVLTVDTAKITLQGAATAARDGSLGTVATLLHTCNPSTDPDSCTTALSASLVTQTALSSPVAVLANQSVETTVELTFATQP